MPDTTVKYFDHTMTGNPGDITSSAGSVLAILDACLVDGFGEVTLDSLSVTSNVATATVSAGHNFAMVGQTGPVILIAGASPAGLNGEWRVTVTSSTQFTFATTGIGNQTATGTITAKRAPAGWENYTSGTNAKYYRSLDTDSSRLICWVSDNDSAAPYVASSNIREGDFLSNTALSYTHYLHKSDTYSRWMLVADHRAFYLANFLSGTPWSAVFFGDLAERYDPADAYAVGVGGHVDSTNDPNGVSTNHGLIRSQKTTNSYGAQLAKSKAGTLAIQLWRVAHENGADSNVIGAGGTTILGNREIVYPVEAWEGNGTVYRGKMPGWYASLHGLTGITGIVEHGGLGRTLKAAPMRDYNTTAWQLFDVTGPWR